MFKNSQLNKFCLLLFIIVIGLSMSGGFSYAANIYYDLDTQKVMSETSGGFTMTQGALNITATAASIWQVTNADLTIKTNTSGDIILNSASTTTISSNLVVSGASALATTTAATLAVTGISTLTGLLNANGGIAVDTTNFTVSGTTGAVHTAGDFDVATDKFTIASATGNTVIAGTLDVGGDMTIGGTVTTTGHIIPSADDTYDLGSTAYRWRDLYLGPSSLHIGTADGQATFYYTTSTDKLSINKDVGFDKNIVMNSNAGYAWSENAGWLNLDPSHSEVIVADAGLTGYAWSENAGWVKFDYDGVAGATNTNSTNWGVTNDGSGNLGGYAWSENAGWIISTLLILKL